MSVVDKVVTEWAYRCRKGYPDMKNPDDMKILKEIYSEYGIVLEEEKPKDDSNTSNGTDADVAFLRKAFDAVKDDYAKYLKVFILFDPNSLGTVSEILLTKLLAKQGIETKHTGGAQGLTDLIVNGHHISLKTTSGGNKIGLGSEKEVTDSNAVELANYFKDHPEISNYTVADLAKVEGAKAYYPAIIARIKAVAKKLTGEGNAEFFVWVEKTVDKKTGLLQRITIHTLKYDYNSIMNTFSQGKIVPTRGAGSKSGWHLVDVDGTTMIEADIKAKYLNISPDFIRRSTNDTTVSVDFPPVEQSAVSAGALVSKGMFDALDNIYAQIYGSGN